MSDSPATNGTIGILTYKDYIDAINTAISANASGLTEAATRYSSWVAAQEATRVVTETEKFNRFAADLGTGFRNAAELATTWGNAARDAGKTGIAAIMDKYGVKYAQQADAFLNGMLDQKANLDLLIAEARTTTESAERALGGTFGHSIGPAFDAAQMIAGAVEWATTGESDSFGGACMGVLLSAGGGLLGALIVAGAPIFVVGTVAAAGAALGSWAGNTMFGILQKAVSEILGTTPDPLVKTIKYVPYVDPLILDLDGDGLEITPLSNGILFDTNNDTVKTGTAWAGADDGLLVRELNGNGTIDSGADLFGDETLLSSGQTAANGFAALAELDSNPEGKFDALDSEYANLRIWRDVNQDGVSQANELQSLTASGVKSINLSSTASSTQFVDATLVKNGNFTRSGGGTGQAGSFVVAQNNFVRSFTPIAVSDVAWVCDSNRQRQCTKLTGRQMSVEFGGFQL